MKTTKYSIKISNIYTKPTPIWLKKTADMVLGIALISNTIMITIPDFPHKEWVVWGVNAFGLLFKFITKGITEEPTQ